MLALSIGGRHAQHRSYTPANANSYVVGCSNAALLFRNGAIMRAGSDKWFYEPRKPKRDMALDLSHIAEFYWSYGDPQEAREALGIKWKEKEE